MCLPTPRVLLIPVLLLLTLRPGAARAAFVVTDGANPSHLRRGVAVGLVRIAKVHVNRQRKRAGYVLHRHVDLTLVRMIYGPRPPAGGLRRVPYATVVNTAWPLVKGALRGRWFVMAWVRGQPCGLGSTVAFSRRVQLPYLVTGPRDPWIEAIGRLLRAVDQPNLGAQLAALDRAYGQSKRPRLAYLADAALVRIRSDHRHSAARFLRLLALVATGPGADPVLGWPLVHELSRFPALKDAAAYRVAWRGGIPRKWPFSRFRDHVIRRLGGIASDRSTHVETRRNALLALARPPCIVASARGPVDAVTGRAIQAVRRGLGAGQVTVRRTAVTALLQVATRLRRVDGRRARGLVTEVKRAILRERDASERSLLRRRLRAGWR